MYIKTCPNFVSYTLMEILRSEENLSTMCINLSTDLQFLKADIQKL